MSNPQGTCLSHIVFFTLKDKSEAKKQALVEACRQYLSDQPGVVFFSTGTREPELAREVNDKDFDVSLNLVFESREAQDIYQSDARHDQFIAEQKDNWERVRVFDSNVPSGFCVKSA
ncbi:MAG: Dabb family protein [Planctomycetales bacterium]|nr:Dabb family protein [Planctomycetales bacterium]